MRETISMALMCLVSAQTLAASPQASDAFRKEHAELHTHLEHARQWAGELKTAPKPKPKAEQVLTFFKQHIAPHAAWEEERLYPLVDRLTGSPDAYRFTASMRHEHRIVERWIGELDALIKGTRPDYARFARRADNLLGLVEAHFEEEEQVLLPIIDAKMTAEEFARAIGSDVAAGKEAHGGADAAKAATSPPVAPRTEPAPDTARAPASPLAKVAEPSKKTERLWKAKCGSCHGANGDGATDKGREMKVTDMTTAKWQASHSDKELNEAVLKGIRRTREGVKQEMDGFEQELSRDDVAALVQYVRWLGANTKTKR